MPPEATKNAVPPDLLQMKYLKVDRNYETLKQLTRKGKEDLRGVPGKCPASYPPSARRDHFMMQVSSLLLQI